MKATAVASIEVCCSRTHLHPAHGDMSPVQFQKGVIDLRQR
jgi:hypothetical protein